MAKKRLGDDPLEIRKEQIREGAGLAQEDNSGIQDKQRKRGRPKTSTRVITKSSQEGTKEGYTRATFIVREDLLEKLKAVSYWDRKTIKKVVEEAFRGYLKDKKTKAIPKEGE